MSTLLCVWNTVLEALFPVSGAEKELFSLTPEKALNELPAAPAPPIINAASIFAYKDDRVAKLVWNIKYKKSMRAVEIGGYALYRELLTSDLSKVIIVPMPITPRRRRERGFNQCELLVDEIARLDEERRFIIEKYLLKRIHHASRQTLKDRGDRLESAKGIFATGQEVAERFPRDSKIIIIDDVITTGSTMREAIEILRNAGFEDVVGLSLAH